MTDNVDTYEEEQRKLHVAYHLEGLAEIYDLYLVKPEDGKAFESWQREEKQYVIPDDPDGTRGRFEVGRMAAPFTSSATRAQADHRATVSAGKGAGRYYVHDSLTGETWVVPRADDNSGSER